MKISIPQDNIEIQVERQGERRTYVEQLQGEIQRVTGEVAGRCIEAALEAEVTAVLGRDRYERRASVARRVAPEAECNRCHTHATWQFSRNGHYERGLSTRWGQIRFAMPQLACECGGSVKVQYQTVRPRQRIWDDVEEEMRERHGWGASLRAIKASLDRLLGSSLGLRTINARVHALGELARLWLVREEATCPPVVRVDGVWLPQMVATGEFCKDSLGRRRAVKRVMRRPLLVAQGVWPARGRQAIVGWVLRDAEGTEDWVALLNQLRARGIRPARGLQLLTADGSGGLPPALAIAYGDAVRLQRCTFHKLRNLWRDLVIPQDLARQAAPAYKRRLIRQAAQIWQAPHVTEARERQRAWCREWEADQPEAAATLRRDFDATLSFYAVQAAAARRGENWPATCLRTTSHLERFFRGVRRRGRRALVLHSEIGLIALLQQCMARWTAGQATDFHERTAWPRHLERQLAASPIS